jgi:hypothetical protein
MLKTKGLLDCSWDAMTVEFINYFASGISTDSLEK